MTDMIFYIIYFLMVLDAFLFIILLIRKIVYKIEEDVKEKQRDFFIEQINRKLESNKKQRVFNNINRFNLKVFEDIIFDYLKHLKGDSKYQVVQIAKDVGIVNKYLQLLKKRNWLNQANAAYKLGILEIKEAIPFLLNKLHSKSAEVVFKSAEAILKISGKKYLIEVINSLSKYGNEWQKQILDLIDEVEEDIYPVMETLLCSNNVFHVIVALRSLGKRKDYRVLPYISKYLNHNNKEIRIAALKAAEIIGDTGDKQYFKNIIKLKDDEHWEVRSFLAKNLGVFKNKESIAILKELMQDSKWIVRNNAGKSLLKNGEHGILALSESLFNNDKYAQDMSWNLLQKKMILDNINEEDFKDKGVYEMLISNIHKYRVNNKKGD